MIMYTNTKAQEPESEDERKPLHKSSGGIAQDDSGTWIDATVRLAEVGSNNFIRTHHRALAQAATLISAIQERNSVTVASHVNRWLRRDAHGRTSEASDLMAALWVHKAGFQRSGDADQQVLSMDELLASATVSENRLGGGQDAELVGLHIPLQLDGEHSLYLKALNSKVWAFAQVGVAVWLRTEEGEVAETRLVASGITPTLWRLSKAEQMLTGQPLTEIQITRAVESLLQEVMPTEETRYKIPLVKGLIHRALNFLAHEP